MSLAARFRAPAHQLIRPPERIPDQPWHGPSQFLEEGCVVVVLIHTGFVATNSTPSISNCSSSRFLKSLASLLLICATRFVSRPNFPGAYSAAGSSLPLGSTLVTKNFDW